MNESILGHIRILQPQVVRRVIEFLSKELEVVSRPNFVDNPHVDDGARRETRVRIANSGCSSKVFEA
jgi:hypothetical protein